MRAGDRSLYRDVTGAAVSPVLGDGSIVTSRGYNRGGIGIAEGGIAVVCTGGVIARSRGGER